MRDGERERERERARTHKQWHIKLADPVLGHDILQQVQALEFNMLMADGTKYFL